MRLIDCAALCAVAASVALVGCSIGPGQGSAMKSDGGDVVEDLSLDEFSHRINGGGTASQTLQQMTFAEIYSDLLRSINDRSHRIDGIALRGMRSKLVEHRQGFADLGERFATYKEYAAANSGMVQPGFNPAQLRKALLRSADMLNEAGQFRRVKRLALADCKGVYQAEKAAQGQADYATSEKNWGWFAKGPSSEDLASAGTTQTGHVDTRALSDNTATKFGTSLTRTWFGLLGWEAGWAAEAVGWAEGCPSAATVDAGAEEFRKSQEQAANPVVPAAPAPQPASPAPVIQQSAPDYSCVNGSNVNC